MEPPHLTLSRPQEPGNSIPRLARRTIRNYDCGYHIILTNVKAKGGGFAAGDQAGRPAAFWDKDSEKDDGCQLEELDSLTIAREPQEGDACSARREHDASRNLSVTELRQRFVDLGQRARCRLASDFSSGG